MHARVSWAMREVAYWTVLVIKVLGVTRAFIIISCKLEIETGKKVGI
jgi:hypothetical protein